MVTINLLPWRKQLREARIRQLLFSIICSFLIVGLLIGGIYFLIAYLVKQQRHANLFLQNNIAQLERQISQIEILKKEKAQLLAHINIFQQLQYQRSQIIHFFDELVKIVPDGAYLVSIEREKDALTIKGRAEAGSKISLLMRNIAVSHWFNSPLLREITSTQSQGWHQYNFKLNITETNNDGRFSQ